MYPLPPQAYSASVVRRIAEGILELLREPATPEEMFAASPRWPPEQGAGWKGGGWRPAPWLTPRLAARLPWVQIGNPSGTGHALVRYTLLAMSNANLIELSITPMSTSAVGRIRFLRVREGAESIDLRRVFREPRRPRYAPWRTRAEY